MKRSNGIQAMIVLTISALIFNSFLVSGQDVFKSMRIGYGVPLNKVSAEKMKYAKSVGIDCIEIGGFKDFIDDELRFTKGDAEVADLMRVAKRAVDDAQIEVWSIHMPFSKQMDLSTVDEGDRKKVVDAHLKLLKHLEVLGPKIILFHPSFYLDPPNQRELRKKQLIKSIKTLNKAVRAMGATLVVENMLGPELMIGERERPLMRTVEETVELFERLPRTVYSAVDMNHIKNPERLIRAMGKRLKHVHIADGTGEAENHWSPCSGKGKNDWVAILKALDEAGYTGPFMYESAYEDEKELVDCYKQLVKSL